MPDLPAFDRFSQPSVPLAPVPTVEWGEGTSLSAPPLGHLTAVEIRETRPGEASDLTPWLPEDERAGFACALILIEEPVAGIPWGMSSDEEGAEFLDMHAWVVEQGLPEGELSHELANSETGEPIANLDLTRPDGLEQGFNGPVALLLNEGQELLSLAKDHGCRDFTFAEKFGEHVEREVLALVAE